MIELTIPLFPLHTVLFPGGVLPLRIFEPRYLDMVSHCLRNDTPFGICLIREGSEVGAAAVSFDVGTLARIDSWDRGEDGILSLVARGYERFRIVSRSLERNQLSIAFVRLLTEESEQALPEAYEPLAELLDQLLDSAGVPYSDLSRHPQDAAWVGSRLTELLPLSLTEKQALLETADPLERLDYLFTRVRTGGVPGRRR